MENLFGDFKFCCCNICICCDIITCKRDGFYTEYCVCEKSRDYSAYLNHETKTYEDRNFFLIWCDCSCNGFCFNLSTCRDGLLCPSKDRKLTDEEYNKITQEPQEQKMI